MKVRISIIGPIGDIGGRELETGFIAESLANETSEVSIISTANFTKESQLFDFVSHDDAISLNQTIYNKNLWFRCLSWLAYLKSGRKKPLFEYVSNAIAKKTGYNKYAIDTLKGLVDKSDIIVFCAQVTSTYVKELVNYAYAEGILTVIRTSGTIKPINTDQKNWLEKVSKFIHHSETNASSLSALSNHNYAIIDQCTFKEEQMLQIEPTNKCNTLLYLGRLSNEKGILELVTYYKSSKIALELKIIGDGPLFKKVEELSSTSPNIQLLGYKNQDAIIEHITSSDCIIIPSHEESGPLVGLEAMASARLVISTKVGAMPHRLKEATKQFWLDINNLNTLSDNLDKIKELSADEIKAIAEQNREIYLSNYAQTIIESQYKKTIFNLVKT